MPPIQPYYMEFKPKRVQFPIYDDWLWANFAKIPQLYQSAMDEAEIKETGDCLLDCARYGDLLDVQFLLSETRKRETTQHPLLPQVLNYADGQGTTALHRAGANGHAGVVHVLLDEGAAHVANRAGNTPLHWAVQNGQEKVVALLCERVPGLDVLAVNADGKSCISFAFERGNDKVLNILLEHPSAEKLQESKEKDGQTLLHEIAVAPGKPVLCREIGFTAPGDGEGEEDGLDNTGAALWGASLILARWVLREEEILRGRCVVELGAGCGLPGITALRYSPAEKLYITDLASKTFDNLKFNVERNLKEAQDRQQKPTTVQVLPLDWKDETTWPAAVKDGKAEVILGADLVYDPALVPPLVEVVTNLLAEGGTFMYVSALSSRAGLEDFCSRLQQAGLQLSVHAVADDMLANPMASEEKFRLHFKELSTDAFNLYKFVK